MADRIRIIFLPVIFFISFFSQAQTGTKFRVDFSDKNNSPFSVSQPDEFLSTRAIDRRTQFNIPVTEQDLPVNPSYLSSIKSTGAIILTKSKWFNSCVVEVSDSNIIDSILQFPFVINTTKVARICKPVMDEKSEINHAAERITISPISSDSSYYGLAFNQINMIKGQYLHLLGYQGEGILIAVLDAGFNNTNVLDAFAELYAENRIIATRDFVDGDEDVYIGSNHGTSVLSTIALNLPGTMVGTAPDADFILLRTEYGPSELIIEEENWIAGAEFADSMGADLLTTSLGYTTYDDSTMSHTISELDGNTIRITRGADVAASKGMIVVNSAGNEGDSTNSTWIKISAPADGDSVFTIGAVRPNGDYATFSGKGPSADGRVKPNVVAQGQDAVLLFASGVIGDADGTSFSGPIIAGMIACLRQAVPDKSNIELYHAVENCASVHDNPNDSIGYGIPDFYCALKYLTNDAPTAFDNAATAILFPNPFHDKLILFIKPDADDIFFVEMFDLAGRKIFESLHEVKAGNYYRFELEGMNTLANGSYIVRLTGDSVNLVKKVVKM